jgi:hypothetical protein
MNLDDQIAAARARLHEQIDRATAVALAEIRFQASAWRRRLAQRVRRNAEALAAGRSWR